MKFDYTIQHVPGKFLYIADALSRTPLQGTPTVDEIATQKEVEIFIDSIAQQLPASSTKLQTYRPNMMILFVVKLLATEKVVGLRNTQSKLT